MTGLFDATKSEEREIFSLSVNFPSQSIKVLVLRVNHAKLFRFFNSSSEKK